MNKKISFILVICILFMELTFPMGTVHAETYGIYTYTINNGEVTITDCDSSASGSIEIPAYIDGYSVTHIRGYTFYNCSSLKSITIPDSVTSIDERAFYNCSSLESITIPDSVTSIGSYAFYICSSLEEVHISDINAWCNISFEDHSSNPLYYANKLYLNNELVRDLTIPDDVTNIGSYAFCSCSSLTSITIPNSITSIGSSAFYNCSSLTSITIPNSVTSIGKYAFDDCSSLTSITIPNSVTSIGAYAFSSCSSLTSITIPDSVTSIDGGAFSYCSSLESITIPDSVTSIGDSAFYNCSSLEEVHISDINAWCNISFEDYDSNPLYYAKKLYLNNELIRDLTISDDVTNISSYAFYNCGSLTSITIPDSITSIGSSAFFDCSSLTSITIPDSVTSIGESAFSGCSSLTSVTIPDSVISIGESAFSGCSSLTSVTIPDSVISIGESAFSGCSSLISITIPDSVTSIGAYAFSSCSSLTNITIPDSVTSIGSYAFSGCSSLTSVTIPNSVTIIGSSVFYNCSSLTSVTIPDSVTHISGYTFYNCSSLTNITIPDSVASIGSYAFSGCRSLTSVTIPDSVTSICYLAFDDCSSLEEVHISDIAAWCNISFERCNSNPLYYAKKLYLNDEIVRDLTIPDDVTNIGSSAFFDCSSLTSITIPDSVTSIGESAFSSCSSLTSVTIPDSVISIGEFAFSDCSSLTSISIPNSVTSIGDYAFSGCSSLKNLYYGGIQEDWNKINLGSYAIPTSTLIHYLTYVTGMSLDKKSVDLIKGNKKLLTATITPGDATNKNIVWSSSDENIAVVENGLVTAVSAGKAIITASTEDGGYNSSCNVTVKDLTPETDFQFKNGTITKYIGTDTDIIVPDIIDDTKVIKIAAYAFSGCSITSIMLPNCVEVIEDNAFINSSLTDLYYDGTANDWEKVTVGTNAIPDNVIIHHNIGVTNISLDKTKISMFMNRTEKLTAVIEPDNAYNKKTLWTSSDENVATVENGIITPISLGQTIITVTAEDGGFCASCTVSVCTDPSLFKFNNGIITDCYSSDKELVIPDTIDNIPVTSIGKRAFSGCNSLTSIIIPDSVTSIGACAFSSCSSLTSITIPDSVTSIGESAFSDCSGLISITIPNSVTSIGAYAFSGCSSLTSITIPNSVKSIGDYAFSGCSSLASITIPDSVTSIGNVAFSGCGSLASISIPNSVTSIGWSAFSGCGSLASISIPNSVTSIGDYAFSGCSNLTSITIPSSITSIGNYVFYGCGSLKIVVVPNSVTSIGDYAFSGCSGITNIIMSDRVTSIGESTFSGCSSLKSITIPDSVIYAGSNAFYNCSSLEGVYISDMAAWCSIYFKDIRSNPLYYAKKLYLNNNLITDLVIPLGVTSIEGAFVGIDGLKSIRIPTSLQSIGSRDFASCMQLDAIYISDIAAWCSMDFNNSNPLRYAKNLYLNNELVTDLVIPDSISSIKNDTFYGCNSITSVVISNNIITIGSNAFRDCINIKDIKLGYSVADIKVNAFLGCSSIEKITLDKNNTNYVLQDDVLYNRSKTQLILYPCGSDRTSFVIPDTVTNINNGVFKSCKNLKSLTIPGSIKNLDNKLFSDCSSLTSVTILSGVTSVGDYAFSGCSSLISITIPDSVTSIGEYAFSGCSSFTSITIPDSVTSVGDYAFSGCSSLTSIIIPDSVTSVGGGVFSGCISLTSIIIPDSVTSIGGGVFSGCISLTSITIPDSVTSIGGGVFSGCISLTSITIPDSVTSVGDYAFSGCSSLISIIIPDSVTSIGDGAFYNCSGLSSITMPNSLTSIGKYAFQDCISLTNITIPNRVISIGYEAFDGCSGLTCLNIPASVTRMGDGVLYPWTTLGYCAQLAEISVDENNTTYCSQDGVLFNKQKTTLIKYPEGNARTTYNIPNSVTNISVGAFNYCNKLVNVHIPDSVTKIDTGYFFTLPFEYAKLAEISVDENNSNYSSQDGVLFNKQKTTLIEYPKGNLRTTYSIPDSVTSIGQDAFSNCSNLTSIIIPDSVTSIGYDAFSGSSLIDVYYSGSESDREKINIRTGNNQLLNAKWHYESSDPINISVIKAADISAKPGTSVKVDIMLENNPGTAIIGFNIEYDGNAMTLASVTNGEIFDDADILNGNIQKNPYMFTCMNSTENKNGDGVLISLTFNISENCPAGDYAINISGCEAYSIDESAIDFKTVNSKVTVSDGTGAGIDISVSIPNYEKGGTVMAALYDKSGKLLSLKLYDPAETINVYFEQNGAFIKIMQWDMDTMMPLTKAQTINIQ